MEQLLGTIHPVLSALLAGIFTWGATAVGASLVLVTGRLNERFLASMLGFSAGVMVAASFWSLLEPAIRMARAAGGPAWLPPAAGFLLGCGVLSLTDHLLPHLHLDRALGQAEGLPTRWQQSTLLILAITLHNIPEGLAVGVAMGAAASGAGGAQMAEALGLTLGIGIQNLPEGLAVSMPLRASGLSRTRSFMVGQLSALVEPLAAVIAAAAVYLVTPLLPYALAFAAGAMLFVVIEELIPESQSGDQGDIATLGFVVGFVVMMILDVGLG